MKKQMLKSEFKLRPRLLASAAAAAVKRSTSTTSTRLKSTKAAMEKWQG
jgi:hypothetical protein